MEVEALEKWIAEVLSEGVEVNQQFPCRYDVNNGFGYEIILNRSRQEYSVILHKKPNKPMIVIGEISKIRLDKDTNEQIPVKRLIGKKVILFPHEPKRFGPEVSHIAITGTLRMQDC